MRWQGMLEFGFGVGIAVVSTGTLAAQTQGTPTPIPAANSAPAIPSSARPVVFAQPDATQKTPPVGQTPQPNQGSSPAVGEPSLGSPSTGTTVMEGGPAAGGDDGPWGPTPFMKVGILQNLLFGEGNDCKIHVGAWAEFDYTYRNTGSGLEFNPTGGPGIAPVMNRFGDEFITRQLGLMIWKPLDSNCWSWGFNVIALAGADGNFLQPTLGWYPQTNPRFGFSFTDLNLTAHMPILTEGGVDVKIGRQTTILGPMGALAWQRPFGSSDYAWYNMEEGRYTGISSIWHVSKQLDWYNGIEFGWGTFFANKSVSPQYITNISYWLDEEAKTTKVWTTLLTGPTGQSDGNTTVIELGLQQNWNKYFWTILDTQMVYSKAPVFGPAPPGYIERAYDVYTYNGFHLNPCVDLNTRLEWYRDVDGGGYAGGFGFPKTNYYEATVGIDWHPNKWLQVRPEIRYDWANHEVFGSQGGTLHRNQLSIDANFVIKF